MQVAIAQVVSSLIVPCFEPVLEVWLLVRIFLMIVEMSPEVRFGSHRFHCRHRHRLVPAILIDRLVLVPHHTKLLWPKFLESTNRR